MWAKAAFEPNDSLGAMSSFQGLQERLRLRIGVLPRGKRAKGVMPTPDFRVGFEGRA
jgi:hypothetical protein